jgi:hypothetical protein
MELEIAIAEKESLPGAVAGQTYRIVATVLD